MAKAMYTRYVKPGLRVAVSEKQLVAQRKYGYGKIRLFRDGDEAVVEIEIQDVRYEAIRTCLLAAQFDETIYPLGIEDLVDPPKRKRGLRHLRSKVLINPKTRNRRKNQP